eukprot:1133781-Rhodomonas_salina.6
MSGPNIRAQKVRIKHRNVRTERAGARCRDHKHWHEQCQDLETHHRRFRTEHHRATSKPDPSIGVRSQNCCVRTENLRGTASGCIPLRSGG